MTPRGGILVLLAISAGLAGCETPPPQREAWKPPPVCWLYQPVRDGMIGSVGIARSVAAGGPKQVERISRRRAAIGLAAWLGLEGIEERELDAEISRGGDSIQLAGHDVNFADHIDWKGYRYEYAVLDAPGVSAAELREGCGGRCKPQDCDPAWLCDPMRKDEAAMLGVSFRATSLPAQYRVALDNALAQLRYFYGVQVQTRGWFYRAEDSMGSYRVRVSDVDVEAAGDVPEASLRLLVTESCFAGEQLFLRVASPDLPPLPHGAGKDWITEPNRQGYEGAVGLASMTSDGQMSSQIELAVERGFGELTGAGQTALNDSFVTRQTRTSKTVLWELTTEGEATIAGRVMGFYFEPQDDYRTTVYVWVVKER